MGGKEKWASRVGLVLAMAGNAVGLGNFLRFPAQAVNNGGGAFLIPYFVALLVMGIPLMWVEWSMGRYGGQRGHHSTPGIFQSFSKNPFWKYFGAMGLWSCLIIAAFYLYIESWCLAYAGYSAFNGFSGMLPDGVKAFFYDMTGERTNEIFAIGPWGMLIFAICVLINIFILSKGLARGIELVAKIGMPLLIIFAGLLAIRGLFINPETDTKAVTSSWEGLNFVWQPKFDRLGDAEVWLAAAGQIFFTLSIGMGSIHCYASYLAENDDIALTGATSAWTNEFCEVILGGTILIPIAVAYLGLEAVKGQGGFQLGFFVFPTLFENWGALAPVAGFMWFGLLFFAAITSSLAMGQPIMAFFQQEFGMTRPKSALALALLLLPLAIMVAITNSGAFFDEFDYWAGTVMLVVFALGEAILFAWVFGMNKAWDEMNKGAELRIPKIYFFILKYVTPTFLIVILSAYAFKPEEGWTKLFKGETTFAWSGDGMIGKILHKDIEAKIDVQKVAMQKAADMTDGAERQKEVAKAEQTIEFLGTLKTVRNIDRLVMLGVFGLLCLLIAMAWRKRRLEGRE